ncbi:DUF1648 domain-containing protein [Arthrobacter sp. HLT1-20]
MGEQVRGVEAEGAYNRRWLTSLMVGPLLLGVLAAVWLLTVADRLPEELASHWNGRNEVDGWMSLAGTAWMAVGMGALGAVIASMALLLRAPSTLLARIGVGFGLAIGGVSLAMTVAVVAGQLDVVDTSQAQLSGPAMAAGVGLAFVVACVAAWLYKPGEVDRSQSPEVLAANDAATASGTVRAALDRAARGETLRIKVSMGAWSWAFSLGLGGIVAVSSYFIFPILALIGVVVGAITWLFSSGTAVIGPDGVKVLAAGRWRLMPLQWKEIRAASVEHIKALDYGGWGYRMGGGSVGFIMASGPALVMKVGFHQSYVISMPDVETAAEAAALVNAYVLAGTVKN